MQGDQNKPAAGQIRRGYSLTWIDFLVIAVTVLTLAAVADAAFARRQSAKNAFGLPSEATVHVGRAVDDPALIAARIRLATGL